MVSHDRTASVSPLVPFSRAFRPYFGHMLSSFNSTPLTKETEATFVMVKSDGVQRGQIGPIIQRFEQRGFKLVAMKMLHATRELLEKHYEDNKGKFFFTRLINYMSSGPVVVMVWEGLDAVATIRIMLGTSNPLTSAPGTIRGDFALSETKTVCHGSDAPESAEREIKLWFPEGVIHYTDVKAHWIFE